MVSEFKRPESVLVIVRTLAGEVLMLRRRHPPYFWQSITGSLEWGESPVQAAERELYEETGLRFHGRLSDCRQMRRFPIIPPWRARYAPEARYNLEHWFQLLLPGRRTICLNAVEHLQHRWLPALQAARLATSWTNRDAILLVTR